MKNYKNGDNVSQGFYFTVSGHDIKLISEFEGQLRGKDGYGYYRIPSWMLIVLSPIIGGLFVVSFPFLIIATAIIAPLYYFIRLATTPVRYISKVDWEPSLSFFSKSTDEEETPEELKDLEKEVNERRKKE